MDSPPKKEETAWNEHMLQPLEHVETRSPSPKSDVLERLHPSTASSSSVVSSGDRRNSSGNGRRSRPSVTASHSQLPSVREMRELREQKEQRALSDDSTISWDRRTEKPSDTTKVDSKENVVSSRDVLKSFSKVVSRNVEKEEARQKQVDRYDDENKVQREIHKRLVKWANTENKTWTERLLSFFIPRFKQAPLPDNEELKSLARHYYPPRAELKCHVCDFGEGKAHHEIVDLGKIEEYMIVKPDWVDVRWIHAPLGLGLMHSSVEDIFLHEGEPGREFPIAGRSGWSYLESEVFNLVNRDYFQEMRDVYLLLANREQLHDDLNVSTWKADQNSSLHQDVEWRADHLATTAGYWNLVSSDMPWQLSEGLSMGALGPMDGLKPVGRNVEKQTLSMFPFYENAHLVRDPFRTFHRSDGFLLSLSPMAGVNYLDKWFAKYLREPIDSRFDNDDASAVGHCFQAFANSGTSTWHRKSVEYFLVYLLSEVLATPHAMRQGCNAPTVYSAYSSVIQELKRRRFEEWQPKATVKLVRKYLACLDELTYITLNLKKKLEMFEAMASDIKSFEAEDMNIGKSPDNPAGESAIDRIEWAIKTIKHDHECFERLLIDLKQSLDALFQLRSIEQNDMAIVSDSQNKAILVFTGVTTVFLPLSFFTSYFGMNLDGIQDSHETQGYFWKVCGTVAFLMVLVVTLAAFSHHIRRISRQRLQKT